jgi:SAM-dependent methyltransferase
MFSTNSSIDYAYPWWLTYGHLPILVSMLALLFIGFVRRWRVWTMFVVAAIALWSGAAFLVDRFVIDVNGRPTLPTERFLASGVGRVLDVGAGTGRSSIMVLQARPHVTLVATDLFGESFDQHFGRKGDGPEERLLANLRAAGVDHRASIVKADMRQLPFNSGEFDAVISAYAMDHVNRAGSDQAIAETARVLKPGGEFLLMVVTEEPWSEFAFGPLLKHGGARSSDWWTAHIRNAGFQVFDQGTRPLTFYLLARRLS